VSDAIAHHFGPADLCLPSLRVKAALENLPPSFYCWAWCRGMEYPFGSGVAAQSFTTFCPPLA